MRFWRITEHKNRAGESFLSSSKCGARLMLNRYSDSGKYKSPDTILNLLLDCFLFQRLQLSSQLFGLISKTVEALSQ